MLENTEQMLIVADREKQDPYLFEDEFYRKRGVTVVRGIVGAGGDYCTRTEDGQTAIVLSKGLNDLAYCCGRDRASFLREMQRAVAYRAFAVVVEASWSDIAQHRYSALTLPESIYGALFMIQSRFSIPVVFAGSRKGAQYATWQFLRQFLIGAEQFGKTEKRCSQADFLEMKQAEERGRQAWA